MKPNYEQLWLTWHKFCMNLVQNFNFIVSDLMSCIVIILRVGLISLYQNTILLALTNKRHLNTYYI
jgi:hypothetical protein